MRGGWPKELELVVRAADGKEQFIARSLLAFDARRPGDLV